MLIRGAALAATLSRHRVDRIHANARIELHPHAEVVRLQSDRAGLSSVEWRSGKTGEDVLLATRALFLFVGADPNTGWLDGWPIELDSRGFVRTGHEIAEAALEAGGWDDGRRPDSLECLVPGLFASGDVRGGSVKRVAGAVGEGAAVVAPVRRCLGAQMASAQAPAAAASRGLAAAGQLT